MTVTITALGIMPRSFLIRLLSALCLGPVVILIVLFGHYAFMSLLLTVTLLMQVEWGTLTQQSRHHTYLAMLCAGAMFGLALADVWGLIWVPLAAILLIHLLTKRQVDEGYWLPVGVAYITLPMLALLYLHQTAWKTEPMMLLWLIVTVWATDIGGYVFGKTIGGPKLAPRTSPNKTWVGLLGGMTLAGVCAVFMHDWLVHMASLPALVGWAVALAVIAQMGDLWESWVKRRFDSKDSGRLIPGHGGLLDRLDGLLAAAIAAWCAVWLGVI